MTQALLFVVMQQDLYGFVMLREGPEATGHGVARYQRPTGQSIGPKGPHLNRSGDPGLEFNSDVRSSGLHVSQIDDRRMSSTYRRVAAHNVRVFHPSELQNGTQHLSEISSLQQNLNFC